MKLQERGWTYNDVTYTFRQGLPPDLLNLLDRSGWLEPDVGSYHWIFDVLVQSLGGNKAENMEHIKHVLAYKYLHPEAYTLPCLMIHGEGGVGKNLLVNHVLGVVFDGQTTSTASANVVGNFNSTVKGKTVVLLDESMAEKVNGDALKIVLGNATITINEKNVAQYDADNTPFYLISSNDSEGGLYLDRSHADRRYSVMLVEQNETLDYWIARHEGWITDDMHDDQRDVACRQAKQWMHDHGFAILTDRQQIACWLGHLLLTYGELPHPMPLHGADFKRLMGIQKPVKERIVEAVFNDPSFTHIEKKVLYKAYRLLSDESGHRGKVRDHVFYAFVETWLKANKRTDIGEKRERMDDDRPAHDLVQQDGRWSAVQARELGTVHRQLHAQLRQRRARSPHDDALGRTRSLRLIRAVSSQFESARDCTACTNMALLPGCCYLPPAIMPPPVQTRRSLCRQCADSEAETAQQTHGFSRGSA